MKRKVSVVQELESPTKSVRSELSRPNTQNSTRRQFDIFQSSDDEEQQSDSNSYSKESDSDSSQSPFLGKLFDAAEDSDVEVASADISKQEIDEAGSEIIIAMAIQRESPADTSSDC
jgi:hypothetical protein